MNNIKLLFENWKQFLTEVTFDQAKNNLNDPKTLNKAFGAAKWDLENNEELKKRVLFRPMKDIKRRPGRPLLRFIPDDIEDNQRGSALLWLIRVILRNAPSVEEKVLRVWITIDNAAIRGLNPARQRQRIGGALETFFTWQDFMSEKDINKIKTLKELHDVVEAARPAIKAHQESKSYLNAEEGKTVIYEDDDWQIIIPTNKGAACELGKGTEWCTAVADAEYYEQYHKPDDPLFIFIEKVESGNIEIQEGEEAKLELKDMLAVGLAGGGADKITIALYNEGKELVKEFRTDFKRIITFDTKSLASGTYHYIVKVSSYQFHFGSEQFMNRNDESIEGNKELFYSLLALLKKAENVPAPIKEKIKNIDYQKLDNGGIFIGHLNGGKGWYLNNKLHRTDGPAYVWAHGAKGWYLNHMLHRTDGPAYVDADGRKFWYLNDDQLSKAEWEQEVQKMKGTELTEQRLIRIIKEELRNYETPI